MEHTSDLPYNPMMNHCSIQLNLQKESLRLTATYSTIKQRKTILFSILFLHFQAIKLKENQKFKFCRKKFYNSLFNLGSLHIKIKRNVKIKLLQKLKLHRRHETLKKALLTQRVISLDTQ